MYNFLWVALGGALGSVLRFSLSLMFPYKENSFPTSTFTSNILASFILGMAAAILLYKFGGQSSFLKYFVIVGICGGFSTFSSFAFELFNFHNSSNWFLIAIYSVASIALSVLFIYAGYFLIKNLV